MKGLSASVISQAGSSDRFFPRNTDYEHACPVNEKIRLENSIRSLIIVFLVKERGKNLQSHITTSTKWW